MNTKRIPTPLLSLLLPVCFLLSAGISRAAEPWPRPANYVSDFAGVLDDGSERQINAMAKILQDKTTAQIAVVTINSIAERGYADVEEAAVELFEAWAIGQKGKDNGLLVLVAVKERKWRIEVGYGLEGAITDGAAGRLGRTLLPDAFRQGRYGEGLLNLCTALVARVAEEYSVPLSEFNINPQAVAQARPTSQGRSSPFSNIFSFIIMIILFLVFIQNPQLFLMMLLMSSGRSRGNWGGGSHYGGGGGFGGGFGGFGGGRSGGGGASGGW